MDITEYIDHELYVIIPVLYILGTLIKKSEINDRWIPLILGAVGIILATAYKFGVHAPSGYSEIISVIYTGITQGILCASASVYANNIVKQIKKGKDEDDDKSDSENGGSMG